MITTEAAVSTPYGSRCRRGPFGSGGLSAVQVEADTGYLEVHPSEHPSSVVGCIDQHGRESQ
ncbi:hypothetical protein [Phreatobacter stygius]|uniref:Uncharacterized protein n=1 Tax=Phreatobacter stygius TaxID=1940610 RepID=A0A4D7BAR9_9HYPH|nr:hypothetical protein [Phreatobacter stygius]QCI67740.1 hypothetical protein E8M01_28070 [Phreatobacter stygius]